MKIEKRKKENRIENNEKEKKTIREIRDYAQESYDKLIVFLSSGALVLTMGFVKNIVEITEKTNTIFLKLSWVLFAISLIIILLSHKTTIKAMDYELKDQKKHSDRMDRFTNFLNWSSMFALIGGITTFIIFIHGNL